MVPTRQQGEGGEAGKVLPDDRGAPEGAREDSEDSGGYQEE